MFQPARLRLAAIPILALFSRRRRLSAKRRKMARLCWAWPLTDATVVLIQDPVDCVLYAPVSAGGSQEQFGIGRQTGDEVTSCMRSAFWQLSFGFDHDQVLQL